MRLRGAAFIIKCDNSIKPAMCFSFDYFVQTRSARCNNDTHTRPMHIRNNDFRLLKKKTFIRFFYKIAGTYIVDVRSTDRGPLHIRRVNQTFN